MGFLGFGKKDRVIDLSARYKRDKEREEQMREDTGNASETEGAAPFAFFDSQTASSETPHEAVDLGLGEDRKRRLAKRIMEMTERVEDLSNQVYHLQQRIEVLERKLDIRRE